MSEDSRLIIARPRVRIVAAPKVRRSRSALPFKKTDVLRAIEAARIGGLDIRSVEITKDGTIRLASASGDDGKQKDVFAEWESRL